MNSHKDTKNSQRGVAMFICLFALLLLTAVGMALMYAGDTETSINSNFRSAQAAYYAAKAGLEDGRERLRFGNTYSIWAGAPAGLLTVLPTAGDQRGVVYILNPQPGDNITPWVVNSKYGDDQLCHENYAGLGLGAVALGVPCTQNVGNAYYYLAPTGLPNFSLDPNYGTAAAMPYKWVRISLKQVGSTSPYCVDGAAKCATAADDPKFNSFVCAAFNNAGTPPSPYEVVNPNGNAKPCEATTNLKSVYMVTSLAITNTGARRMVQYEVAAVSLPPFPAALTMDGNGPFLVPPTSNAFTLSGNDKMNDPGGDPSPQCAGAIPGPNMPGIGAVSDPAKTQIYNDIMNPPNGSPRPQNYTGSSGTTPDVQNVNALNPPMDPMFQYCPGIHGLYNTMLAAADQVYGNNPSGVNLGSQAAPLTTVVNGDFTLDTTNANGAGVLVVTGNLTFKGNPPFSGIILVIGKGAVATSSGGGNGNLYGSLFIANCYDAANKWTDSTCNSTNTNPGSGTFPCLPGTPSFDWSKGGGTYNVQYDSCWVNNLANRAVFKVLSSREEMY